MSEIDYRYIRRSAPRRTRYGLLAAVWAAVILYGSLTPFDFKPLHPADGHGVVSTVASWFIAPRWDYRLSGDYSALGLNNAFNDAAINLVLYFPLGVLLRLALRRQGWRTAGQIGAAVALVAAMSWGIECTQGLTLERIASMKDVCLNTLGGAAGVLVGVRLRAAGVAAVFFCFRRVSYPLYQGRRWLDHCRRNPVMMFLAVALDAGIIFLTLAHAAAARVQPGAPQATLVPFARQFELPYDQATVEIGRWLIVYLMLASLLALQFLSSRQKWGVGLVVLAAAAVALLRETALGLGRHGHGDMTEPVLAVTAAATILATLVLLRNAVKVSCRRSVPRPVTVDRRRVPHAYNGR